MQSTSIRYSLLSLFLFSSTQSLAGGLYLYEMANTTDVGTAGAGLAAKAQDASVVFNNPAGMTRIHQTEIQAGGTLFYLKLLFSSSEGTDIHGPDSNSSEVFAGGNFSYVLPLGNDWTFGLSAQNFLGLKLDWAKDWKGRYQSQQEWLLAPQVQPTLAYKVNDWLSIGAGAALTYGYLKTVTSVKNNTTGADGKAKIEDTDFAIQGNFGLMFEPTQNTRIGIRYLTETKLDFKDKISTSGIGAAGEDVLNKLGAIELGLYMPQALNVSVFHQLDSKWALLGSVGWDDFSRFGKVDVGFDNTGRLTTANLKTKDVYHIGIATQYQYKPDLLLTAGFSFDSELFNDKNRPMALPMGAMYRYGVGLEKTMNKDFKWGAGVELLWEGDLKVKNTNSSGGQVNGENKGFYFAFASVYASWKF